VAHELRIFYSKVAHYIYDLFSQPCNKMLTNNYSGSLKMLKCSCCSYTTEKRFNLYRHTNAVHKPQKDMEAENVAFLAPNVDGAAPNVDGVAPNVDGAAPNVDGVAPNVDGVAPNVELANILHKCPGCYKVFSRLSSLKKHNIHCKNISHPLECQTCHRLFSSTSSLSHHRRTATCMALQNTSHNSNNTFQTTNINSHNTNISHNTNNGVIVNVNGLGKENIDYITQSRGFKKFMTRCIKTKLDGIIEYLESKHFHPEHPENHNLKKLTKKDDFMQCFDGKKWKLRYCSDIMSDVFDNMQLAFIEFVDATMKDGKLRKVWVDNFMLTVGTPLEWDADCEDYELGQEMTDDQKKRLKDRVYALAIEHIYQNSKKNEIANEKSA